MKSKFYGERFVYSCCSQSLNGESEVITLPGQLRFHSVKI